MRRRTAALNGKPRFNFRNSAFWCSLVGMNCRVPYLLLALVSIAGVGRPGFAQSGVRATLPNGREIRPVGSWTTLAPYPFALAVSKDGGQAAIPSIGFPFAINLVEHPASSAPAVYRIPPVGASRKADADVGVHTGVAFSPDGSVLWVATGDSGEIRAYGTKIADGTPGLTRAFDIPLDGPVAGRNYSGSFAASVIASPDGKTLFALDQGNWRVVVIDAATHERIASIATGRYPYMLALSPDGHRLYVTNTGLFEYRTIPGADSKHPLATGLKFPPFGYPSKAAREGVAIDGKRIPGLGDENSLNGSSLWTYDVSDPAHPELTARLHLGTPVSEAAGGVVGGSAPTGVAASADAVYVSLAHDDAVVKVAADGMRVLGAAQLSPFTGPPFGNRFLPYASRHSAAGRW